MIAPAARPALRLTAGAMLASVLAFGAGLPLPFMAPLLVIVLLAPGTPPPGAKQLLLLVLVLGIATLGGLLVGEILQLSRAAGVLLMLIAVAVSAGLARNPSAQAVAAILILGVCLIGTVASVSSAAGRLLASLVTAAVLLAMAVAHVAHLLVPGPTARPPAPPPGDPGHPGLRAALVMAPPLLLALANPAAYILLVMKGSTLAQQPHPEDARALAVATIVSTAAGGVASLACWLLLRLWPSLPLLVLLLGIVTLFAARGLYRLRPGPFGPDHWLNFLITLFVILGSAVADSRTSSDIEIEIATRTLLFMALSLYAAFAVRLFDSALARRALPA